jgi:hypothetical protein
VAGKTPHWDTPYGTAKPGGKSKLLAVMVMFMVGGGFVCLGCMFLGLADTKLDVNRNQPPADIKTPESVESQAKNSELAQLEGTIKKFKRIVRRKLDPVLNRLRKQRRETKRDLLQLRNKKKHSKSDKFKMKKYLEEFKEISKYIKRLRHEKEKYEEQVLELEFAARKVKRNLEVSDFLDKGERQEIEKLIAKGSVLLETADKGFDHNSLESQVGETKTEDPDEGEAVHVNLDDIDTALEDDGDEDE